MAYRARFNTDDPRFQTVLRNVSKGDSAIKGASAEERGLYSSYGQTEGARLSRSESFGRSLANAEKNLEVQKSFNKQRIGLGRSALDFSRKAHLDQLAFDKQAYLNQSSLRNRQYSNEKDRLNDATIGSLLGLGVGAADVGLNMYSANKHRQTLKEDDAWNNVLKRRWVSSNLPMAYSYGSRYPELGISSYLPAIKSDVAGQQGHEAFRLSKY